MVIEMAADCKLARMTLLEEVGIFLKLGGRGELIYLLLCGVGEKKG